MIPKNNINMRIKEADRFHLILKNIGSSLGRKYGRPCGKSCILWKFMRVNHRSQKKEWFIKSFGKQVNLTVFQESLLNIVFLKPIFYNPF